MQSQLFIFLFFTAPINAYKILVFSPTISRSHMISNGRIADELAKTGHDVTIFEPEWHYNVSSMNNVKFAKRFPVGGFYNDMPPASKFLVESSFIEKHSVFEGWTGNMVFYSVMNKMCEQLLQKTEVIEKLKSEKFDIYFGEQLSLCGTGLSRVLEIKTHIWVSSTPLNDYMSWVLAAPMPLSYVPTVGEMDLSDKMSYPERSNNILAHLVNRYQYYLSNTETTSLFRKYYGQYFPHVEDIARESSVVFVNTDEVVDFPRPTLHNVVHIGGLGLEEENLELDEVFKAELSKDQKGVIVISFGSNVATTYLPLEFKKNLIQTIKSFPEYHFILKIIKDDEKTPSLTKDLKNVFLTHWAPQPAILSSSKVVAFVTHGGYNSLLESARFGVPVIVLPFFGDQFRNGRVAERNGWGVVFNKVKLLHGSEEFIETIHEILTNQNYKENALRTSKLIQSKPFSASDRLIKWTEFVAVNGGSLPELQVEGRRLSFVVYHNLDIFIPIIFLTIFIIFVILYMIFWCVKKICECLSEYRKVKTQ